jgi:hypothetical protein
MAPRRADAEAAHRAEAGAGAHASDTSAAEVALSPAARALLDAALDWGRFDVFALAAATGGRPLAPVAARLLAWHGAPARLRLPPARLAAFFAAVEDGYGHGAAAPAYHNAAHAADVAQAVGAAMAADWPGWAASLPDWEALALLVAAAVHDLGHEGLSNDFRRRARAAQGGATEAAVGPGAAAADGGSENERGHAAAALALLDAPATNFLGGAPPAEAAAFRALVEALVLETDMAAHAGVLERFSAAAAAAAGAPLGAWPPEGRRAALALVLHAADISNPARPLALCAAWGARVHAEQAAQGAAERVLGLPAPPARGGGAPPPAPAAAQAEFVAAVVRPTFAALARLAPRFCAAAAPHVDAAAAHWAAAAGPGGGGPYAAAAFAP